MSNGSEHPDYPDRQDQARQDWAMPPAPPREEEAAPVVRPASVDTGFKLWLVAAGLTLLRSLLSFVTDDELTREVEAQTGITVSGPSTGIGGTVFMLVLLVAWVAVVFAMRRGHNWARVLLTVLGGLAVLAGLLGLLTVQYLFAIGALGSLQALCNIAGTVVLLVAIVYLYKAESNRYFARS